MSYSADTIRNVQFQHLHKTQGHFPGASPEYFARLFGLSLEQYEAIAATFADNVWKAADELLEDAAFAARIDALPFADGSTVAAVGDSITDDSQSWFYILAELIRRRRPENGITFLNSAVSGDTTALMICKFLAVAQVQPDWILFFGGTNDCRRHGKNAGKRLVSQPETEANLAELRAFARRRTTARWLWIAPASVDEAAIATSGFLAGGEMMWRNADLRQVGEAMRCFDEPVADLFAAFGQPPKTGLLSDDGLHPDLAGQVLIVRTVVEALTA